MTRLLVLAALAVALLGGVAAATPYVDAETEADVLNRINRERVARGLEPVRRDPALCELARFHSADMVLAHFVSPVSPRAGSLAERLMEATGVAEPHRLVTHVAAGTEAAGTQLGRSLLDPEVTRVGVGVVTDGEGRIYLTELAVADAPAAAPARATYTAAAHVRPARPSKMAAFLAHLERTLVRVPARLAAAR